MNSLNSRTNNRPILMLVSAFAGLVFAACEKVIEPGDLPEQDPRIVINCVVQNELPVMAHVSSSKSILSGKAYKLLDNARCELYENGEFRELLQPVGQGAFVSTLTARTGGEYRLKVVAPGYVDAEGSGVVPREAIVKSITRQDSVNFSFLNSSSGMMRPLFGGSVRLKVVITDDPASRNFYGIEPLFMAYDSNGDPIDSVDCYIAPIVRGGVDDRFETIGQNVIGLDDSYLVNGNEVEIDIELFGSDMRPYNMPGALVSSVSVDLAVYSLSEALYRYRKTANLQATTGPNVFAEPVIVYNNIKNGLGIFGGVNAVVRPAFTGTVGVR